MAIGYAHTDAFPRRRDTSDEVSGIDRYGHWIAMGCFILLSVSIESFVSRQVSPDLLGRLGMLFTALVFAVTQALALTYRFKTYVRALWGNLPYLMFGFVALASFSWSLYPSESLKHGIILLAVLLSGTAMAAVLTWRAIWLGLAMCMVVLGTLSVLIIPIDGLMTEIHVGALRGLWVEKNAMGESMAFGLLACTIVAIADRSAKWWIAGLFLMVLLVLTGSATSFVAGVGACLVFLGIEALRRGPVRFFIGVWLGVIFIAWLGLVLFSLGLEGVELLGRESNLTGRTQIWPSVVRFVEDSSTFGYGLHAFWVDASDTKRQVMIDADFEAHNAHNSFLELMLAFGWVGTSIVGFSILRALMQSAGGLYGTAGTRRYFLSAFFLAMILSLSESTLGGSSGLGSFVLAVLIPKVALSSGQAKRR